MLMSLRNLYELDADDRASLRHRRVLEAASITEIMPHAVMHRCRGKRPVPLRRALLMPLLLHNAILVTCSMKVSGRTKSGIGTIPDMLRGEKLALRSPTILVVWCGLYRSFSRAVDTFAANVIAHNSEIDFHMLMGTSFTQFVSEKQEHRAASRMLPQPNATLCHPTNVQDAAAQSLADALAAHAVDVRRVKMFVMEVPIAAYMTSSDNWARLHSTMRAAAACASVPNCVLPPLHSYEHAVYVRPDVTLVGPPLNFARACAATNGLMIVSGPRNSGRWWHLYDSDLAAVACGDARLLYDLGSGWVAGVVRQDLGSVNPKKSLGLPTTSRGVWALLTGSPNSHTSSQDFLGLQGSRCSAPLQRNDDKSLICSWCLKF